MAGDVLKSNKAIMTVMAAGISRAGGIDDTVDSAVAAAQKGLEFWKEMNDAGNFIPVIADIGTHRRRRDARHHPVGLPVAGQPRQAGGQPRT